MLLEEIRHHGVVLVVIGRVLVAGGNAVAADDRAIHGLRRVQDGGKRTLCIHAVHIGVMQKALALKHVDISHARQLRELFNAFLDAVGLEGLDLVRRYAAAKLAHERSGAKARNAHGMLVLMLMHALHGFAHHHKV